MSVVMCRHSTFCLKQKPVQLRQRHIASLTWLMSFTWHFTWHLLDSKVNLQNDVAFRLMQNNNMEGNWWTPFVLITCCFHFINLHLYVSAMTCGITYTFLYKKQTKCDVAYWHCVKLFLKLYIYKVLYWTLFTFFLFF